MLCTSLRALLFGSCSDTDWTCSGPEDNGCIPILRGSLGGGTGGFSGAFEISFSVSTSDAPRLLAVTLYEGGGGIGGFPNGLGGGGRRGSAMHHSLSLAKNPTPHLALLRCLLKLLADQEE